MEDMWENGETLLIISLPDTGRISLSQPYSVYASRSFLFWQALDL
jgi:hypothetical protein